MSLHLHAPEVVVHPSASEMKKALARTARSLAECAKSFKRWMDGTCIESPDLPGGCFYTACMLSAAVFASLNIFLHVSTCLAVYHGSR